MMRIAVLLALSFVALAQDYKAERTTDHGIPVVRLADPEHGVEVAIVPSVGSTAYEMNVRRVSRHGHSRKLSAARAHA